MDQTLYRSKKRWIKLYTEARREGSNFIQKQEERDQTLYRSKKRWIKLYTEARRDGSNFIQKQEVVVELSICGAVFPHAVTEEGY